MTKSTPMNAATRDQGPLTWGRRTGYAAGDLGSNLYWQSISLFLYFFYTDTLGISPLWAGFAFAIGSIFDAVSDPVMGSIADRTRSKRGRYRPYILWGAAPLGLSFAAMFYVPPLSGIALVIYATLSHVLCRAFYTVVNIPYLAMSVNLSSDSGERANIAGLRMVFAALGAITVAFFLPKAIAALTGSVAQPWLVVALLLGLIATLVLIICYASTRENAFSDDAQDSPLTMQSIVGEITRDVKKFWGMLLNNGPLARVFGAIVVISVALTMFSKNIIYWFKYALLRPDLVPVALVIPALMLFLCAPLWVWFAKRSSKRTAWMLSSLFAALGYVGFYANQSAHIPTSLGLIVLIGMGTSGFAIMYWAMLPDTVEYNEWKLGERNEAKVVGFAALAQKTALAINALILGQVLNWVGYTANTALSADTLAGIKATMCLVPLLGVFISAGLLWKYPISPAFHRRILGELIERDKKRPPPTPEDPYYKNISTK